MFLLESWVMLCYVGRQHLSWFTKASKGIKLASCRKKVRFVPVWNLSGAGPLNQNLRRPTSLRDGYWDLKSLCTLYTCTTLISSLLLVVMAETFPLYLYCTAEVQFPGLGSRYMAEQTRRSSPDSRRQTPRGQCCWKSDFELGTYSFSKSQTWAA